MGGGTGNGGTWSAMTTANAPTARWEHSAVWTGSALVVWGGRDDTGASLVTGCEYLPATNTWTTTAIVAAPMGRSLHKAVYTGSEMLIWGGIDRQRQSYFNTGGRFIP
jgi:hypothetical protein